MVGRDPSHPRGKGRYWLCLCSCGGQYSRRTGHLRTYGEHSCGCAQKDSIAKASAAGWKATTKFSHPHKLKLKIMMGNMMKRCYTPTTRRYERYGGRGITICDQWLHNHTSFYEWAADQGFKPGLSIERIDVDGNYCPENCRFIPMHRQAANTSRNRFITWQGETLTVSDWARRLGVDPRTLQHRVDRGWSIERIFTQPFRGAHAA